MAVITAQASAANATLTYDAATATGDTIAVGSAQRSTLLVRNASAAPVTITLAAVAPCSQGFLHSTQANCAVGDTEVAIPTATVTAAGNVGITYSAATSVTIAAVTS